ncbi:unnamed protein product [Pieris macdunnoughi]|uniref:Uncharacterized protein n=1 Tax=Pieris macdunnoughi TaxID=345717 RepID=A0A821XBH7_9NEOP|nr:unnamed protein product [Pieris macdunnoughi]
MREKVGRGGRPRCLKREATPPQKHVSDILSCHSSTYKLLLCLDILTNALQTQHQESCVAVIVSRKIPRKKYR